MKVKVDVLGSLSLVFHVFSDGIKRTKEEEENMGCDFLGTVTFRSE